MSTVCGSCGKSPPALLQCSNCKILRYCDRSCQKAHRPAHRDHCRTPEERAAEKRDQQMSKSIENGLRLAEDYFYRLINRHRQFLLAVNLICARMCVPDQFPDLCGLVPIVFTDSANNRMGIRLAPIEVLPDEYRTYFAKRILSPQPESPGSSGSVSPTICFIERYPWAATEGVVLSSLNVQMDPNNERVQATLKYLDYHIAGYLNSKPTPNDVLYLRVEDEKFETPTKITRDQVIQLFLPKELQKAEAAAKFFYQNSAKELGEKFESRRQQDTQP